MAVKKEGDIGGMRNAAACAQRANPSRAKLIKASLHRSSGKDALEAETYNII